MKKVIFFFISGLLFSSYIGFSQNVTIVSHLSNISDWSYNASTVSTLEQTSESLSGMYKITGLNTSSPASWPYVYYSTTDKWPSGAWGLGYPSEFAGYTSTGYTDGQYEFYNSVYACHPLMRRTAQFIVGHIHLYLAGYTSGNSLQKIKDAIDYILTQQYISGSNYGGFDYWGQRESQLSINMNIPQNTADIYPTAYALQALSEYYLSGINYKRSEVLSAIQAASYYMYQQNWSTVGNSNYKGFGVWALSEAYKVTGDCMAYKKIKEISNIIMADQVNSGSDEDGLWKTGALDPAQGSQVYHDTKIHYHMIILRGLIEAFNVTPDQDAGFKNDLSNCIKRGINHVLLYRLDETYNTADLRYIYKLQNGSIDNDFVHHQELYYESQNYFEPIIKLAYYSQNSSYFTSSERNQLRWLSNRFAQYFHIDRWRYFKSAALYIDYMDAINNSTQIFPSWSSSDLHYNSPNITDRVVHGDFDNDGFNDDIAAFYDYGNNHTMIHLWTSNGSSYTYSWSLDMPNFNATSITGRVVSGDFDNDGHHDDIAAFFDHGDSHVSIELWKSNGSSFNHTSNWSTLGYDATKITGRVVSGDFDNDGTNDDIAAFYDYGNGITKMHQWAFNGSSISYSWPWETSGYNASKITGRVVSGDFDNDGHYDDIIAFYDYGYQTTKMHQWAFNGSYFSYSWPWETSGYDANMITGRVVSGDFDNDNYHDDIAAFYNYGKQSTKLHEWKFNGSYFSYSWPWETSGYDANMITGRVVSGCFSQHCNESDISAFYNYGVENTRIHTWISLNYQGPTSWWLPCPSNAIDNCHIRKQSEASFIEEDQNIDQQSTFSVYPNPFTDRLIVNQQKNDEMEILILNSQGQIVLNEKTFDKKHVINMERYAHGMYLLKVSTNTKVESFKLIKN